MRPIHELRIWMSDFDSRIVLLIIRGGFSLDELDSPENIDSVLWILAMWTGRTPSKQVYHGRLRDGAAKRFALAVQACSRLRTWP